MTAAAAVASFGAPGSAQTDESPFEVVSRTPTDESVDPPTGGDPWSATNRMPTISDDGDVIAFAATDPQGIDQVVVRVRSADETVLVPDPGAVNPAISGDGCVVGYSVFGADATSQSDAVDQPVDTDPDAGAGSTDGSDEPVVEPLAAGTATIRLFDRCAATADPAVGPVDVTSVPADGPLPPTALSENGAVVAVTTGTAIVRFDRAVDGSYGETARVDAATGLASGEVVGDTVDISADGALIVFEAGSGPAPFEITEPSVRTLTSGPNIAPTVVVLAAGSRDPSMSSDGQLVVLEVVAPASPTDPRGLVLHNAGVNRSVPSVVAIDESGTSATIDPGGRHIVFEDPDGMRMASWAGSDANPFATVVRTDLSVAADGTSSIGRPLTGVTVAEFGRFVAFDSASGAALTTDDRFATGDHVWLRSVDPTGGGPRVDLGAGDVGAELTGPVTITNNGPASLPIGTDGVGVDAPFVVTSTTCVEVLHPGQSCVVDVSITIEVLEDVLGLVRVGGTGDGAAVLTAEVIASGESPTSPTTAATTPTTTRTTTRSTPGRTTRTTRSTTRRTTATTATTTAPTPLVFDPTTFEFAPTIVNAGRRTATVSVVNPGTSAVFITDVRLDPSSSPDITVSSSTCPGTSLGAGQTCTVDLVYAPTAEGSATATLGVVPSPGVEARLPIFATGAPPPGLEVLPGVASHQQVVAVRGFGFPAGASVVLSFGELIERSATVDETGGFTETIVIMPSMPTGPIEVVVAGQVDLFADVSTSMLVSSSGPGSGPAIHAGFGPDVAG